MQSDAQIQKGTAFRILWNGVLGAAIPLILLAVSIIISMLYGVAASEDWGGFARRINFGKTTSFYISLAIWAMLAVKAFNPAKSDRLKKAQTAGLAIMLILWLILL